MKKAFGLIFLAGVLALSIPGAKYWAGTRIERQYQAALSALPPSAAYRIQSESYSRGVFTSEARSAVELLTLPGGPVAVSLTHRITHGPLSFPGVFSPFLAVVETRLEPSERSSEGVKKFFGDHAELLAARDRTVVGWDGRARSHFEIPPFRKSFGARQVLVDWKGLTADTVVDKGWGGYKSTATLPGLEVSDEEFALRIAGIGSAMDLKKSALGLYLGSSEITLGALSLKSPQDGKGGPFTFAGAKVSSALGEAGGLLNGRLEFGIDKLQADTLALDRIGLELQMRNIEAASLVAIRKELDALQGAGDPAAGERIAARLGELAREHLPVFLAQSPEILLSRLEVTGGAGTFSGTGRLAVDGAGSSVHDVAALLPLVAVDADVAVDEGFLRQMVLWSLAAKLKGQAADPAQLQATAEIIFAAQLQPLVDQGYLVKEAATYKASLRYRQQTLTVNGKPLGQQARR